MRHFSLKHHAKMLQSKMFAQISYMIHLISNVSQYRQIIYVFVTFQFLNIVKDSSSCNKRKSKKSREKTMSIKMYAFISQPSETSNHQCLSNKKTCSTFDKAFSKEILQASSSLISSLKELFVVYYFSKILSTVTRFYWGLKLSERLIQAL